MDRNDKKLSTDKEHPFFNLWVHTGMVLKILAAVAMIVFASRFP